MSNQGQQTGAQGIAQMSETAALENQLVYVRMIPRATGKLRRGDVVGVDAHTARRWLFLRLAERLTQEEVDATPSERLVPLHLVLGSRRDAFSGHLLSALPEPQEVSTDMASPQQRKQAADETMRDQLHGMDWRDIQQMAKELGISNWNKTAKPKLIAAILEARA